MVTQLTSDQVNRYRRHLILPEVGMEGQKKLLNAGYRPDPNSSSEKMQEYIRSDLSRWEPLIKELGLKLD